MSAPLDFDEAGGGDDEHDGGDQEDVGGGKVSCGFEFRHLSAFMILVPMMIMTILTPMIMVVILMIMIRGEVW